MLARTAGAIALLVLILAATAATKRLPSVPALSTDSAGIPAASDVSRVDTASCPEGTIEPSLDYAEFASRVRYPEDARQAGIQGRVLVRVLVEATGMPTAYYVTESPHALLTEAAVKAIMSMRFVPARLDGMSVTCWVYAPVVFQLD